eukprot:41511_1
MAISFANFSYAVMLMYLALTFAALSNHVSAGNGTVKLVYPKTNKWNNIGTVMTTLALSGPNAALTVGQLKRQIGTEINIVPGCLQFASFGNMMTDSGVLNSYPRDGDDVLPILVVFRRDAPGCSRYFETFDNLAPEFEDPLQSGKVLYNADRSIKHGRKEIVVTAQESNQWTCPKCTFKNAKIMTRCETCLTPKLNPVAPKSNHMAPKFESTAPKSKRTAPKSKRTAPKSKRMAPKFEITPPKSKRAAPKSKVDQALPDYWNDGPVRVDPLQDKTPSFINLKTGLIVCILVVLAIWIYRIKFHSK